MKITDIKLQQNKRGRYSIYVDGKYSFSLSDWQFAQAKLSVGQDIEPADLQSYKDDSAFGKTFDRTLMWLSLRSRSEWEIDEYLHKKTSDDQVIERIKEKVRGLKQIDDLAFARSWVSSRRSLKSVSRRRLRQELAQKRVSKDVIETVLGEDEVGDLETIRQIITKKSRQSRYQDKDKMMAYLARQGFSYEDIKAALMTPVE
jgi:regulatory protein